MPAPLGRPRPVDVVILALRGVVVLGLALAAVRFSATDAALLLLVLGGAVVPRALRVPAGLEALYLLALLAAAWSSVLDLYETVEGWDLVMHLGATGVIAAVAYWAVHRLGVVPHPTAVRNRAGVVGVALVTAGLGSALSVLWEVGEWAGNAYLDPTIGVGYVDTVGDMAAGMTGSAVAGLLLVTWGARRRARGAGTTAARAA